MFGVHSVECPPLPKYFSLLRDYLYPSKDASVQYLRAGSQRGQSVPEVVWAWGMGRPASKYTTHNEQTGYASMSREQWLGDPAAVGSQFQLPNGSYMTYTEEMAQCMRDQINGLAADYADWCHRRGFTPHLGDQNEILRGCNGEDVGCAFFHYQASKLPGTTTNHSDPGEGRYPADVFIAKALAIYNGGSPVVTPASPNQEEDEDMALSPDDKSWLIDMVKTLVHNGVNEGAKDGNLRHELVANIDGVQTTLNLVNKRLDIIDAKIDKG
jgi:hypothetical protein